MGELVVQEQSLGVVVLEEQGQKLRREAVVFNSKWNRATKVQLPNWHNKRSFFDNLPAGTTMGGGLEAIM